MREMNEINAELKAKYGHIMTEEELSDPKLAETLACAYPSWAAKALDYIGKFQPQTYASMKADGTLIEYLANIEMEACLMEETLTQQYRERFGATEELKRSDQMKWVGLMNNIRASVREVIYDTLIYTGTEEYE